MDEIRVRGGNFSIDYWDRRNKIVGSVKGAVNHILNVDSVDASDEEVARGFGPKEMTYGSFMNIPLALDIRRKELIISEVVQSGNRWC